MKPAAWQTLLVIVLLAISGVFTAKHLRDQHWVAQRTREIVPEGTPDSIAVMMLAHYVRTHVRYENAPYDKRPFLRASARSTLESGLGYCGEATRTYIAMVRSIGIDAQRVNLHGAVVSHVVPEVEIAPNRWVLVDIQINPITNALLDSPLLTVDEVLGAADSPFLEYSNINLRRLPLISHLVRRIRLNSTLLTWVLESPALIKAWLFAGAAALAGFAFLLDAALLRWYGRRLKPELQLVAAD